MRGYEQCSTSYAAGSSGAPQLRPRCRQSRAARQAVRHRPFVVAAEPKDTQLAQQTQGVAKLVTTSGSESFMQQKITLKEAHDGTWADKVEDWGAFWAEDEYLVFEDEQLDDTYDGLVMGKLCATTPTSQNSAF